MKARVRKGSIVILDFGGQYAHLIANRVRRLGAFSEIRGPEVPAKDLKGASGIILSGGPQSVYEEGSPQANPRIFDLGVPILGICYGHQWIAHVLGGEVKKGKTKEYGRTIVRKSQIPNPKSQILFHGLPNQFTVWMSHGDAVVKLPPGFQTVASSRDCENAAMEDSKRKIFGVQFHVEVTHTPKGVEILKRFVDLCDHAPWSIEDFAGCVGDQVKKKVGDRKVFMLVSGGVDSTVAFTLLEKTLGKDRVYGLLVDTGLMRKDEVKQIQEALSKLGFANLHVEDAFDHFFKCLKDVYDPEDKRRVIGDTFLEVQREVAKRLKLDGAKWMLGQGTIYPDTIETGGTKHADRIKTHHNRVLQIQKMIEEGRVIEPLQDLYKDEVRKLGELLGLPRDLVWRHPFPGPGLAVRMLCAQRNFQISNPHSASRSGSEYPSGSRTTSSWPRGNFQGISNVQIPILHAVLPIRSVGVQGDARTYKHALVLFPFPRTPVLTYSRTQWNKVWQLATSIPNEHPEINRVLLCTSHAEPAEFIITPSFVTRERADLLREADAIVDEEMRKSGWYEKIWQFPVVLLPIGTSKGGQSVVLRPVDSTEAMTANATRLPRKFLKKVTERLLKLKGINLVFYDLTSKPPATIEWE